MDIADGAVHCESVEVSKTQLRVKSRFTGINTNS